MVSSMGQYRTGHAIKMAHRNSAARATCVSGDERGGVVARTAAAGSVDRTISGAAFMASARWRKQRRTHLLLVFADPSQRILEDHFGAPCRFPTTNRFELPVVRDVDPEVRAPLGGYGTDFNLLACQLFASAGHLTQRQAEVQPSSHVESQSIELL